MALNDIYTYFRSWDDKSYKMFAQQKNIPTPGEIEEFETEIGFGLPEEFREFCVHRLGGLYFEVKEELWPRPEGGPFWSFLYAFYVNCLSKEAPDFLNLKAVVKAFRRDEPELIPFLRVIGDPNRYCFTKDQKIVLWHPDSAPEPCSETFSEIVMKEIRALEKRKAKMVDLRQGQSR